MPGVRQTNSGVVITSGAVAQTVASGSVTASEADAKLRNRWYLSGSSPFTDQVGSADATDNGTTQVTGNWVDGAARQGDGSSAYIDATDLGTFGGSMDNSSFAIACTIKTADTGWITGVDSGSSLYTPWMQSDGSLTWRVDGSGRSQVATSGSYDDGNPYRIVFNCTSNATNAGDMDIWVNQSQASTSTENNNLTSTSDFAAEFTFMARSTGSGFDFYGDVIIDDFCIFDDSLTNTEIQSYTNPF